MNNNTVDTCGNIMEATNILLNSVGDGLQLPGVIEEMFDASIWSQKTDSMPEDSIRCGGPLPLITDNQYSFFQQAKFSNGFNNTEQSHNCSPLLRFHQSFRKILFLGGDIKDEMNNVWA